MRKLTTAEFIQKARIVHEHKYNYSKRDAKKKKLCKENGIKLMYYSELNIDLPDEVIKNVDNLLEILKNSSTFAENLIRKEYAQSRKNK